LPQQLLHGLLDENALLSDDALRPLALLLLHGRNAAFVDPATMLIAANWTRSQQHSPLGVFDEMAQHELVLLPLCSECLHELDGQARSNKHWTLFAGVRVGERWEGYYCDPRRDDGGREEYVKWARLLQPLFGGRVLQRHRPLESVCFRQYDDHSCGLIILQAAEYIASTVVLPQRQPRFPPQMTASEIRPILLDMWLTSVVSVSLLAIICS
jgi:hypothetical protein